MKTKKEEIQIKLTHDEAIVLFEFFSRFSDTDELKLQGNFLYGVFLSPLSAHISVISGQELCIFSKYYIEYQKAYKNVHFNLI